MSSLFPNLLIDYWVKYAASVYSKICKRIRIWGCDSLYTILERVSRFHLGYCSEARSNAAIAGLVTTTRNSGYGVNDVFIHTSLNYRIWSIDVVPLLYSMETITTVKYLLYSLIQVILLNFIQVYICCLKFRCFSFQVIKQASGFISGYIVGNILNLHQRSFNLHSCQF